MGIVVLAINFLGTRAFGECEFWFASIKVLAIVGLTLVGLVIDLGGTPSHDRLGFRYWVCSPPSFYGPVKRITDPVDTARPRSSCSIPRYSGTCRPFRRRLGLLDRCCVRVLGNRDCRNHCCRNPQPNPEHPASHSWGLDPYPLILHCWRLYARFDLPIQRSQSCYQHW